MSGGFVIALNKRERQHTPFDVDWGTVAPNDINGANGDYYFRYHNGTENIYKKVDGSWVKVGGGTFSGFDSSNSELIEKTSDFASVTVSNFTITSITKLRVEKDGVVVYENKGWTRNTGTNSIDFDTTITASTDAKVLVFVGTYS